MLHTIRYSTRIANPGKVKIIQEVHDQALELKNQMSQFCFQHLDEVDRLPKLKFSSMYYKQFIQDDSLLSAWEHQCMLSHIYGFYMTYLNSRLKRIKLHLQSTIRIIQYRKNIKDHKKGDIKKISLTYKAPSEKIILLVKYLIHVPLKIKDSCIDPSSIEANFPDWINPDIKAIFSSLPIKKQQHLLKLVAIIRERVFGSIKPIIFTTGSYTKLTHWPAAKDVLFFQRDDTNQLYKYWYRYTVRGRSIWLPLQINKRYHPHGFSSKECVVTIRDNLIMIFSPTYVDDLVFKEPVNIEGVDLNLKHNFCCFSNGQEFDYNRKYLAKLSKKIKRLDGMKTNPSKENLYNRQMTHLCRRTEGFIKKLIHDVLNYCEDHQITDLVLEDLGQFRATFIKDADLNQKLSRLIRLLRLSSVKTWFTQQAEKRGIRVHTTPSYYTSQTCPVCGNVDAANRPTQEEFICTNCGHHDNADHNAAINIRNRYTLDVLRDNKKLHTIDPYNRMQAMKIGYRSREIVLDLLAQVEST